MAIVPTQRLPKTFRPNPAVSIEEYSRWIDASECEILGVANAPNQNNFECRLIWSLSQRQYIQQYLSEAQEELEQFLGYFLNADWVVGDIASEPDRLMRYVDQQTPAFNNGRKMGWHSGWYKNLGVFKARWKHLIKVGTRAESDIELGATVSYATEPAVVTVATSVEDINEIHVYHPGSNIEINVSEITLAGGTATISIPRCRLVKESLLDNDKNGVDYNTISNFEETVDVKRVFTDTTKQATVICSKCGSCETTTKSNCLSILNERQGTLEMKNNTLTCSCGCVPERIGLNYYCGEQNVTQKAKEMIIRLSHTKMPSEPCGCLIAQRLWQDDREVSDVVTNDQLNNPFGIMRGALITWQWVRAQPKVLTLGSL